jgi:glyceronephosphate O-acyltransferase
VLASEYVQKYVQSEMKKPSKLTKSILDESKNYDKLMAKANSYLDEMQAIIRPAAVRPLLWILSKIWGKIYD